MGKKSNQSSGCVKSQQTIRLGLELCNGDNAPRSGSGGGCEGEGEEMGCNRNQRFVEVFNQQEQGYWVSELHSSSINLEASTICCWLCISPLPHTAKSIVFYCFPTICVESR